jgi:hypothetical protein
VQKEKKSRRGTSLVTAEVVQGEALTFKSSIFMRS